MYDFTLPQWVVKFVGSTHAGDARKMETTKSTKPLKVRFIESVSTKIDVCPKMKGYKKDGGKNLL